MEIHLRLGLVRKTYYVLTKKTAKNGTNAKEKQRMNDLLAELALVLKEHLLPAGLGSLFGVLAGRHFEVFRINLSFSVVRFLQLRLQLLRCGSLRTFPATLRVWGTRLRFARDVPFRHRSDHRAFTRAGFRHPSFRRAPH